MVHYLFERLIATSNWWTFWSPTAFGFSLRVPQLVVTRSSLSFWTWFRYKRLDSRFCLVREAFEEVVHHVLPFLIKLGSRLRNHLKAISVRVLLNSLISRLPVAAESVVRHGAIDLRYSLKCLRAFPPYPMYIWNQGGFSM